MIDIVRNSYNTGTLPNGNSFFGINEKTNNSSIALTIYPNPASDQLNILFDRPVNEVLRIQIINTSGTEVYSSRIIPSGKKIQLDVSSFPSGIYIINVQAKDFTVNGKAIIIK
jgi:Secretion system C-terminal sorting domain